MKTIRLAAQAVHISSYNHSITVRWPIPVKQIQVNENKFKLTKTHPRKGNTSQKTETTPRKRKQLPENENKFNLTKTNSSKPKQIQVNENRFTLRNSSCGRVVDIFCLVIHRQTCSFSPIGLLTRDIVGSADTLTSYNHSQKL